MDESKTSGDRFGEVVDVIVSAVNLHHIDKNQINADTRLTQGGLELDSVDILEVVVAIEQHFGIKVPSADAGKQHFQTFGTITNFVTSARGESAGSA